MYLDFVEDPKRYSAPPEPLIGLDDMPAEEMTPYEEGYEARDSCENRESNPYSEKHEELREEWFAGWDDADGED